MPITRRRRANPPDQPENNNHQISDQAENPAEMLATEQPSDAPGDAEQSNSPVSPTSSRAESIPPYQLPTNPSPSPLPTALPPANGERVERLERQEYTPTIEGGRRTARGELFRRPPQPPAPPMAPPSTGVPLQAPTHEIKLPLGEKPGDTRGDPLHLAYNPGYTGSEEVRSALLQQLALASKNGGRARCWSCGSLAIAYDRWNTRSKAFGEIGVAFCEICGVWSVM